MSVSTQFAAYDAQLQKDKPDARALNLLCCDVLYEGNLYLKGVDGASQRPNKVQFQAQVAAARSDHVVFDIEQHQLTIDDYATLLGWAREKRAGAVKYGFYGIAPVLSGNVGVLFGTSHPDYAKWQAANDALAPIIAVVDMLCPTLYFRQDTADQNIVNTAVHLFEAHRICQGKPVYPFIWPEKTDFTRFYTGPEFTRLLLAMATGDLTTTVLGAQWDERWRGFTAAGMNLWGNPNEEWDPAADWLVALQTFQLQL